MAGVVGTAAMTVSSSLEARIRGRAASSAPARATTKVLGIKEFEDDIAAARFNDLSHWGYGTMWGVVRGLLASTGLSPRAATAAHGAAVWGSAAVTLPLLEVAPPFVFWGSAAVTLPALEIAPPFVFWGKEEVAIDLWHHTVYATATGLAYRLIDGSRQ